MRFKIPGQDIHVRLFERVETTDPTYDIFDVGFDYDNPDLEPDTIAVGGSFGSIKRAITNMDNKTSNVTNDLAKVGAVGASVVLGTSALASAPVTAPVALVAGAVGALGLTSLIKD